MKLTSQSLLAMMVGHPFYISENGLRIILAVAAREEPDAADIQVVRGTDVANARRGTEMKRRGDVAIIPVYGPLVRHADIFDEISGATSLDGIADDLGTALADSQIGSIVLDIDSVGGESNGIAEMAETIRNADSRKPVTAYVGYMGASAAYYIASGAGRIVASRRAFVGSIGTLSAWTSTKARREQMGLKDFVVVSSQTPKKGLDPETEEGLAELQEQLDFLAGAFIEDVAKYRKTSKRRVAEEFGQGGIVNSPKALSLGMIDDLGTLESTIAAVSGGRRYRVQASSGAAAKSEGTVVARKTWGQFFAEAFGRSADDEIPDGIMNDPPPVGGGAVPSPPAPSFCGGSREDDPEKDELRRQLAAANARADSATATAAEDARIQQKVTGWVQSGRVTPAESHLELAHCRELSSADRAAGRSGDAAWLARYEKSVDSRQATEPCRESVPGDRGGGPYTPPAGPTVPKDQAAEDDFDRRSATVPVKSKVGANGAA